MKCPVCKEVDLVMSDRQAVEINYCPTCRGVWLDRGRLDTLIERSLPAVGSGSGPMRNLDDDGHDDEPGRYSRHGAGRRGGWFANFFDD
jgi:uncharacterized protein